MTGEKASAVFIMVVVHKGESRTKNQMYQECFSTLTTQKEEA
jgi:hypothetical protein